MLATWPSRITKNRPPKASAWTTSVWPSTLAAPPRNAAGVGNFQRPERPAIRRISQLHGSLVENDKGAVAERQQPDTLALRLPPVVGPEQLTCAIPDSKPQVARRSEPGAAVGHGKTIDAGILDVLRRRPRGSALREARTGQTVVDLAVGPQQVEVVSLGGSDIKPLRREPANVRIGIEGEGVADLAPPAGLARVEVDRVQVMVPVERRQQRSFAVVRQPNVANVRAEQFLSRRIFAGTAGGRLCRHDGEQPGRQSNVDRNEKVPLSWCDWSRRRTHRGPRNQAARRG